MNNQDMPQSKPVDTTHNRSPAESVSPPLARLVCTDASLDSSLQGLEIELTGEEQTIGRAETNTVVIDYMRVSRQHARIYPENGQWIIKDISSTNGIFIGNVVTPRAILKHGEKITIASIPFRFELQYNGTKQIEEIKPVTLPKTVRKQLDQNPEATIVLQSSPFTAEKPEINQQSSSQYGWFVAIALILIFGSALIASVFA